MVDLICDVFVSRYEKVIKGLNMPMILAIIIYVILWRIVNSKDGDLSDE